MKNRRDTRSPTHASDSAVDDVVRHMANHFGPVDDLVLVEVIPVRGIKVHVIRGKDSDDPTILFTTGMSDRPQNVPPGSEEYRYTELFVRLPAEWPLDTGGNSGSETSWPIEWLRKIANYPHENDTWLGGPFTIISNGEPPLPLGKGTKLTCMMLLCETDDPDPVRCRDGRTVYFYSLVPLYTEERDLEKAQGVSALFERLTSEDVPFVLDPSRRNAARRSREGNG